LVRQKTQAINALRAHPSELGVIVGIGTAKVAGPIEIVRDETDTRLPKAARFALSAIADQIEALTRQIGRLEQEIVAEAKRDKDMRRLTTIPGVGGNHGGIYQGACSGSRRGQIRPPSRSVARIDAEVSFEWRQGALGQNIEDGQS